MMVGYDKAIVVDAIPSNGTAPGKVIRLTLQDFAQAHSCNPHDISLPEAIQLAKKLDIDTPDEIVIIGVVVDKTIDFGEDLTEPITKAIPVATEIVLKEITSLTGV